MKFRATLARSSNAIGILIKNGSNAKAFNEVQCTKYVSKLRRLPPPPGDMHLIPALYSRTLKMGLTLHRDQYTHEYSCDRLQNRFDLASDCDVLEIKFPTKKGLQKHLSADHPNTKIRI